MTTGDQGDPQIIGEVFAILLALGAAVPFTSPPVAPAFRDRIVGGSREIHRPHELAVRPEPFAARCHIVRRQQMVDEPAKPIAEGSNMAVDTKPKARTSDREEGSPISEEDAAAQLGDFA